MEIGTVKPIDPFDRNVKPNLSEVPLKQIEVPKELLDTINKPVDISWLDYQLYLLNEKVKKIGTLVKLVPFVYIILKGKIMNNWKTTLSGIIGALAMLLKLLGVEIPPDVLNGVIAIAMFCVGLFAHDAPAATNIDAKTEIP